MLDGSTFGRYVNAINAVAEKPPGHVKGLEKNELTTAGVACLVAVVVVVGDGTGVSARTSLIVQGACANVIPAREILDVRCFCIVTMISHGAGGGCDILLHCGASPGAGHARQESKPSHLTTSTACIRRKRAMDEAKLSRDRSDRSMNYVGAALPIRRAFAVVSVWQSGNALPLRPCQAGVGRVLQAGGRQIALSYEFHYPLVWLVCWPFLGVTVCRSAHAICRRAVESPNARARTNKVWYRMTEQPGFGAAEAQIQHVYCYQMRRARTGQHPQ
jgi:hypothetical protein